MLAEERFMASVYPDPMTGCWLWGGGHLKTGYGNATIGRKSFRAHRLSFMLFKGPIPRGKSVCHKCDNRLCVNPEHLWLGSQRENLQDMVEKGRHFYQQTDHCRRGHEYTEENTYRRGNERHCRACQRERNKTYYQRNQTKVRERLNAWKRMKRASSH